MTATMMCLWVPRPRPDRRGGGRSDRGKGSSPYGRREGKGNRGYRNEDEGDDDWNGRMRSDDWDSGRRRGGGRSRGFEHDDRGNGGSRDSGAGPGGPYDDETEAMLDEWVEHKRARDFDQADSIREELRNRGIDTNAERPPPGKGGSGGKRGGKGGKRGGKGGRDREETATQEDLDAGLDDYFGR